MQVISVQCIDTYDPKVIRVILLQDTGLQYTADIPEPVYNSIFGALGWPPNPCA